jgi:hypothetical protein
MALLQAAIGSEKKQGPTFSMMSRETSRKLRLFSSGIRARRAPFSMAIRKGSARVYTGLMLPPAVFGGHLSRPEKSLHKVVHLGNSVTGYFFPNLRFSLHLAKCR